jgi:uncharacterized protein YfaS (alpha-2-macroglobulin family)
MHGITVFQDFFVDPDLPVSYTRNDEVTFPVAVYNYLDKEQPVTVSLQPDSWFELLSPGEQTITMPAGAVDAVKFTMRVTKAGLHTLLVTGIGPDVQDAIARTIEVEPGGRVNSVTQSGSTGSGTEGTFVVPANAIADSAKAHVKFYSKGMVHVLEGVDGLLHLPYG